ncbi:hypothetical protein H8E07_12605 [bacterium]|nr:hypothetical protein [bacterium]
MWKRAIIIGIIVIIINGLWCRVICKKPTEPTEPSKPTAVEVFIDADCLVMYADGSGANPIEANVGEFVIWHNAFASDEDGAGKVEIIFDSSSPFYLSNFTIEPGGVYVTQVKPNAALATYNYKIACGSGSPGSGPKIMIGGCP